MFADPVQEIERAPELQVTEWLNTKSPISLKGLLGRPVIIHAFQMLCPGCVSHAIPQTQNVQRIFEQTDLAVLGLHTVFEHHAAMTPVSLRAFVHEYRLTFPIGVDHPGETGPTPRTMAAYQMRGTPTTILIDRKGCISAQLFGQIEDLALGAMIQALLSEHIQSAGDTDPRDVCTPNGCSDPSF
ncbi:MAG: peroxiredoxin [Hyphomicrobiaceae bacterium]|jgi:peroxiredoxin